MARQCIDGRMYFHVMIDPANSKDGVQEYAILIRAKSVKFVKSLRNQCAGSLNSGDAVLTITKNEYFIYNDKGFGNLLYPVLLHPQTTRVVSRQPRMLLSMLPQVWWMLPVVVLSHP